ncbi:unnamed protein product, partial [Musa hybrid cultivar]
GVASGRRFPSDSGAFADWVANPAAGGRGDDLCLGFNAGSGRGGGGGAGGVVWGGPSSLSAVGGGTRQGVNYGLPADMGMMVLASAASYHQQCHHESLLSSSAAAEQHPVIPLLAAASCVVEDDNPTARARPGGIHLWQPVLPQLPHPHAPNPNPNPNANLANYLRKAVPTTDPSGIFLGGGAAAAGVGESTCQDCGNQAKKDCIHRRCRTCCKSRGFECSTHVKSTWVPASQARTSVTPDAGAIENLPGHVRAPAVFKCVRVTSIDDGEDEYAYHAVVKIGGRVFKGFLYDQGLDDGSHADDANDAIPNISELHLGNRHGGLSSSPMLPSNVFGDGGGFIGGTNYGNQTN